MCSSFILCKHMKPCSEKKLFKKHTKSYGHNKTIWDTHFYIIILEHITRENESNISFWSSSNLARTQPSQNIRIYTLCTNGTRQIILVIIKFSWDWTFLKYIQIYWELCKIMFHPKTGSLHRWIYLFY